MLLKKENSTRLGVPVVIFYYRPANPAAMALHSKGERTLSLRKSVRRSQVQQSALQAWIRSISRDMDALHCSCSPESRWGSCQQATSPALSHVLSAAPAGEQPQPKLQPRPRIQSRRHGPRQQPFQKSRSRTSAIRPQPSLPHHVSVLRKFIPTRTQRGRKDSGPQKSPDATTSHKGAVSSWLVSM